MVTEHPCAGCASIAECEYKDNKNPDFWCGPHGPTILRGSLKPYEKAPMGFRWRTAKIRSEIDFARFLISALELGGEVIASMDRDYSDVIEGVTLKWGPIKWWKAPLELPFVLWQRRRVRRILEKNLPSDCMFVEVRR